jgi:bacterioferritin
MRAYPAAALLHEIRSPRPEMGLTASLGEALTHKLVGVLRGRHHHFVAKRHGFTAAADLFLLHSKLEQAHADSLAERIVELEADPDFSPQLLLLGGLAAHFSLATDAVGMMQEELEAAHESTARLADSAQLAAKDLATRRLLIAILDADHQRGKELSSLITTLKGKKPAAVRVPS